MTKSNILVLGFCIMTILGFAQQPNSKTGDLNPKMKVIISVDSILTKGKPVIIRCEIINSTDSNQKIEFTEHHPYHKKLPYATCIEASIKDMSNNSLCKHATQYYVWSTFFDPKDDEYIILKPGNKITRRLNICQIAIDCSCGYADGLRKGKYKVQIYVHSKPSNVLEIEIN